MSIHVFSSTIKWQYFSEICSKKCKPQCSFTKYNIETSWAKFPNKYSYYQIHADMRSTISGNISFDYMQKNYAELSIEIGSFVVEKTTVRSKYQIFSASSGIGGLFGLFLGGSMVTIFELFELFANMLVSGCVWFVAKLMKIIIPRKIHPSKPLMR